MINGPFRIMVNGLHLYSVSLDSGHSKRFTILPEQSPIHAHVHTPTALVSHSGEHPEDAGDLTLTTSSPTDGGAGDLTLATSSLAEGGAVGTGI